MSLRRLPLLAVLLTALGAAPAVHAQSKAGTGAKGTQTVLPVMNKGSGKVEAVLLLEPTGTTGPGARWRFGNNTLDAAFGLEAGDSLGLLCNGPGSGDRRGTLYTARYDFPIASGLLAQSDRMYGHLLAEVLEPGDYYRVDETAYFVRWELVYSF